MTFSSALFIFIFFPVVLSIYFLLTSKLRNIWLLLASLFFYSWGEPRYILLMLVSIISNYYLAIILDRNNTTQQKKLLLCFDVLINLGLLAYFKYCDFSISTFNALFGTSISLRNIALPIGISFYTFQCLSYVIDVYRGEVVAQKNLVRLGLYISFFPQLIAGPIVRYSDIERQIVHRSITKEDFFCGCRRFAMGFSKKVLIADQLSTLVDSIFAVNGNSAACAWIGAIAYALQIFFDFSGYSDMAIGMGRIFGFDFLENFNYPYVSKSIQEFWRRWHISLSSWFRDYVYIPMGGSKCSKIRNYFNLIVVFSLTGLWHGASWNFVIWGLYYVVFLIIEKAFLKKYIDKWPAYFKHIYALLIIVIGWIFFRADTMSSAMEYIHNLFYFPRDSLRQLTAVMTRQYWFCIVIGIFLSMPIASSVKRLINNRKLFSVFSDMVLLIAFILSVCYLLGTGFSPFLYFRF